MKRELLKSKITLKKSIVVGLFLPGMALSGTPIEKDVPVDEIYSPRGYDTLDSAELIISGYLPNACHKNPNVTVTKLQDTIDLRVTSLYYGEKNPFCPEVIQPFVKNVDLGLLSQGVHDIRLLNSSGVEKTIKYKVRAPQLGNGRNELYANVQSIERLPYTQKLILHGLNPSDCYTFDNVNVIDNGNKTISVLPKMKKIRDFCPLKMVPFAYEVNVPEQDPNIKELLHVRTMYGDSINKFY